MALILLRYFKVSRSFLKMFSRNYNAITTTQPHFKQFNPSHLSHFQGINKQHRWYYSKPTGQINVPSAISKIEFFMQRRHRIANEDVIELVNAMKRSNSILPSQSLKAITYFGKYLIDTMPNERCKLVQDVWADIERKQCTMEIAHYNALLKVFIENEYTFCSEEFMQKIERAKLQPNEETYQMLLEDHARKANMKGLLDIMSTMQEKGYPLTHSIISAAILCYGEQGDIESAKKQIEKMPALGLQPDASTYVSLLCAYAKCGDIKSITQQIQCCNSIGVEIMPNQYLDIIYSICVNGHYQHVHTLIKYIDRNYELQEDIINLILQLVMNGMDEAAIQLLTSKAFYYVGESMYLDRAKRFIWYLVKIKRPLENQLDNCDRLANLGLDYHAYLILVRQIAEQEQIDDVLSALRLLRERNVLLTQSYFENLFPVNDYKTMNYLRILKEEFNFKVNAKFMREIVVPGLEMEHPIDTVHQFRSAYVSQFASSTSVAYECLRRNRLKEGAQVTTFFKSYIQPRMIEFSLISALQATKDYESYTKFLHNIHQNYEQPYLDRSDDAEHKPPVDEAIGSILYNTITRFNVAERPDAIAAILPELVSFKIKVAKCHAERIKKVLGVDLSKRTETLFNHIISDSESVSDLTELTQSLIPDELKSNATVSTGTSISQKLINPSKQVDPDIELGIALKHKDIKLLQNTYMKLHRTKQLSQSMLLVLLAAFTNANSLREVKQITLQLLAQKTNRVMIPDLKDILHKFGRKGDVNTIEEIGKYLTPKQKLNASFIASYAYACFVSDKGEQLVNLLSKQLDAATTEEDIFQLSNSFPSQRLLFMLQKDTSLTKSLQVLAQKFAAKKMMLPYNVLFWHFFIIGNVEESQRIWKRHLISDMSFLYGPILGVARQKVDEHLVRELIELLKKSDIHKSTLHGPYGCLLEIYMDQERTDLAINTLDEAQQNCLIESISKKTLQRLRKAATAAGMDFPFDDLLYSNSKFTK